MTVEMRFSGPNIVRIIDPKAKWFEVIDLEPEDVTRPDRSMNQMRDVKSLVLSGTKYGSGTSRLISEWIELCGESREGWDEELLDGVSTAAGFVGLCQELVLELEQDPERDPEAKVPDVVGLMRKLEELEELHPEGFELSVDAKGSEVWTRTLDWPVFTWRLLFDATNEGLDPPFADLYSDDALFRLERVRVDFGQSS